MGVCMKDQAFCNQWWWMSKSQDTCSIHQHPAPKKKPRLNVLHPWWIKYRAGHQLYGCLGIMNDQSLKNRIFTYRCSRVASSAPSPTAKSSLWTVRGSQVHAESGVACTRGACVGRVVCPRGDLISWQAQHFGTSLAGSYVHALMRCVAGAAWKLIWFGRWFSFSFGANLILMWQCSAAAWKRRH